MRDGVVPFAVERVGAQLDSGKLLLAHLDPFGVLACVQLALNAKAGSCGGSSDQVDDDFMAHQRFAAPVLRDEREQTMLDLVPFAGSRRKVADRNLQSGFIGQFLQLQFPQPHSRPVAASAVRCNQELTGIGVCLSTHHVPPAPDTLDGERRRVMIGANADPTCILPQIVNSIGNVFLLREIMHLDKFGLTLGPPFAPPVLVVPYLFLLFRVYGNRWLTTLQEFRRLRIDVFKLRIAVRMRGAFLRLAVRLQAVLLFVQQFRNQHMAHRMSLGSQFVGEIAHAFACPLARGEAKGVYLSGDKVCIYLCPWSGDCGSPRVTGSSSFSRSGNRLGSLSDAFLRPPPFCRIGRRVPRDLSGFFFSSVRPTAIARLEIPLARDTSEIRPRPRAALSAAAPKRRERSSSHGPNREKRCLISASLATRTF